MGADLHVGDLELHHLVGADRLAERLPLVRVPQRLVHAALRQPDAEGGDGDAALVQDREELRVAPAALAEQVLGGDPAVGEGELTGVGGVPAHLGVLLRRGEAPAYRHGTMIVEISLRPPCSSPVTAVTVTSEVMSVPELVMNDFVPLMTHSPPSTGARRAGRAGVGAAAGLGQAERRRAPRRSTAAGATAASAPRCRTGRSASRRGRPPASRVIATEESTRASSSRATQSAK